MESKSGNRKNHKAISGNGQNHSYSCMRKKKEKKKERLGVEQSWQGDFLSLARNFLWMYYAGAENLKGVEESY
jgi:hypothetical protein